MISIACTCTKFCSTCNKVLRLQQELGDKNAQFTFRMVYLDTSDLLLHQLAVYSCNRTFTLKYHRLIFSGHLSLCHVLITWCYHASRPLDTCISRKWLMNDMVIIVCLFFVVFTEAKSNLHLILQISKFTY